MDGNGSRRQSGNKEIKRKETSMKKELIYKDDATKAARHAIAKYIPILFGRCQEIPLEIEVAINGAPPVDAVYICNRKRCEFCVPACNFTRDIDFAATTDKAIVVDNALKIIRVEADHEL